MEERELAIGPVSKIYTSFIQGLIWRSLTATKVAVVPLLFCNGPNQNTERYARNG